MRRVYCDQRKKNMGGGLKGVRGIQSVSKHISVERQETTKTALQRRKHLQEGRRNNEQENPSYIYTPHSYPT